MSHSPERISSYRRHYEGGLATTTLEVRLASPTRRAVSGSRKAPMSSFSGSMGALCIGMGGMDMDTASAENKAFLDTRTIERQEMITLNDRLAKYIEKVLTLESQNKALETEIDAVHNCHTKPSGVRKLYEGQLRQMMRVAEEMRAQRDLAVAAKDAMAGQLEIMRVKYEEAVEARKKVEMDIEAFRPDVDLATAARIALEKQLDNLEREVKFLQRVHKQEIEELMAQIYNSVAIVGAEFEVPDLSAAVRDIQAQYDSIAARSFQEMDTWYKGNFQDMNKATSRHAEAVRSLREEITGFRRETQKKELELESLRTRKDALEAQIREAHERHHREEEELQTRIRVAREELKSIKSKMAIMLKEYQNLLNIKMALDIEITTYRKLVEGEDIRLNGIGY